MKRPWHRAPSPPAGVRVLPLQEKGTVLAMTLLVITLLAGLTLGFSEDSAIEMELAGYWRDAQRAYHLASSGVHFGLCLLDQDKEKGVDTLREDWSRFEGPLGNVEEEEEVSLSGRVADESRKFPLHLVVTPEGTPDGLRVSQLRRLLLSLGLREALADPLIDWLDADSEDRPDGAEESFYRSLEEPYSCANGPFQTIGQVFLVKGMKEIARFGDKGEKRLLDYLTIYSDGRINVNTAPAEVLLSLSDRMDVSMVEAIMQYRRNQDFEKVEDLTKIPAMEGSLFEEIKDLITVKATAFSLEFTGRCRGAQSRVRALAVRGQDRVVLACWQVL